MHNKLLECGWFLNCLQNKDDFIPSTPNVHVFFFYYYLFVLQSFILHTCNMFSNLDASPFGNHAFALNMHLIVSPCLDFFW